MDVELGQHPQREELTQPSSTAALGMQISMNKCLVAAEAFVQGTECRVGWGVADVQDVVGQLLAKAVLLESCAQTAPVHGCMSCW